MSTTPRFAAYIDLVKGLGICDSTGHVEACGYDEDGPACDCSSLPSRLSTLLEQHETTIRADERERIAQAIESDAKCSCRDSYCAIRSAVKRHARIARTSPTP